MKPNHLLRMRRSGWFDVLVFFMAIGLILGAMGLAGLLKQADQVCGKKVLTILCGANVDFEQLAWISHHAGIGAERRGLAAYRQPEFDRCPGAGQPGDGPCRRRARQ